MDEGQFLNNNNNSNDDDNVMGISRTVLTKKNSTGKLYIFTCLIVMRITVIQQSQIEK